MIKSYSWLRYESIFLPHKSSFGGVEGKEMKQPPVHDVSWGYLRVSTNYQKTENQRLAVLEYANKNGLTVDHWIEAKASTRKSASARKIDELHQLVKGDILITAELSRLGRSVGQIAMIVDELLHNKVKLICIKENMELTGKRNVQSKVMITMFSLFAEIERDLRSETDQRGAGQGKG